MQKTNREIYRIIEKVILKKNKNKAFVKLKGYPDKFNSWVKISQLRKIISPPNSQSLNLYI